MPWAEPGGGVLKVISLGLIFIQGFFFLGGGGFR